MVGEVLELAGAEDERFARSHFRDKEGREVDVVIEDRGGRMVGGEVEASATVREEDFTGLERLAEASGARFAMGLPLHDRDQVTAVGDRLAAVPLPAFWG